MIDKSKIEKRSSEIAEELHAGGVYRDIQAREKERNIYEERWFWELLQNAKDSVSNEDTIDVKLIKKENEIIFSHTGLPFELDEILSLIFQGSTKTEKKDKTGRFGTGFMTTYLLSKKVEISGHLAENGGFFSFLLNRNGDNISEFFKNQKKSKEDFINSIKETTYLDNDNFQTQFKYELDDHGEKTANKGLQSLNTLIPVVQIFNDKLNNISIDSNDKIIFKKELVNKHTVSDCTIEEWTLLKEENTDEEEVTAYLIKEDDYEICLLTRIIDNKEILVNLKDYPKLFFTFPLIGTEELGIPFIINSTYFDPKVERDGVYLVTDKNEINGVERNKEIIQNALRMAIKIFPDFIVNKNIKNLYEIYNFSVSKQYSWVDNDWLNDLKQELFENLSEQIVLDSENNKVVFKEIKIPYLFDYNIFEQLYDLLGKINSFKLIKKSNLNHWQNIFKNLSKIYDKDIFEFKNIIGIKGVISFVEKHDDFDAINKEIDNIYSWLDDFYNLIISDLEEFPSDKKIILNQNNIFKDRLNIYWDLNVPEKLKDISKIIEDDLRDFLINKNISKIGIKGIFDYTEEKAISRIKEKLNNFSEVEYQKNENLIKANAKFLLWLVEKKLQETIKDLKVISKVSSEEIIKRPFPNGRHLLLSPIDFFKTQFPLFANLIRERDCLHPIYNEVLNDETYKKLSEFGFIHYLPLVIRKEKIIKDIDLLIHTPEDINFIKTDNGNLIQEIELEYSDFAYLTANDGHIYARNSTSQFSLKILNFLLNEATIKDNFFQVTEYIEINGKTILFDKSLWLKRAKNIQWVNTINIDDSNDKRFISERPSSKNLSELLKGKDEIISTIKGEAQINFLTQIGVGVSDLIRNTLSSDEERIKWDKALTNMITSNVDPELVEEIFKDPNIQKEYEKRLNERKLISRNQQIGALIEKLFREIIEELKLDGVNINIERKPFGSDYILTEDSSDLIDENKKEELFQIGNWLVELKATGKDYAAMTQLQAETAVKNKTNYALIVVELDGSEPDKDYVKRNAKIIDHIGNNLSNALEGFKEMEEKKTSIMHEQNGISVNIEDRNIRFRINSKVWNNESISLDNFIIKHFKK